MPNILYEKKGNIAYVTINRPEAMNSINGGVMKGLGEAWASIRDDPEVWSAIITGAGDKAFCTGMDLKGFALQQASDTREHVLDLTDFQNVPEIHPYRMEVWKPVIAAVAGYCLAGGLELALSCDIRVASETATFGLPEVQRGIIAGGGGTQNLPRLVPFGIAMEMLLTGERITAQEAYRIGLVNKVVAKSELLQTAQGIAEKINSNGPVAVRATKESAYRGSTMNLRDGLRLETFLARLVMQTEDSKEGSSAFSQKRKPVFKGK